MFQSIMTGTKHGVYTYMPGVGFMPGVGLCSALQVAWCFIACRSRSTMRTPLFPSTLSTPIHLFLFWVFGLLWRNTGDFPPAAAEDAEGVHRAPRVRPQAPVHRADQEWNSHRRYHLPSLPRAEVRRDRLLRSRQQFSGTPIQCSWALVGAVPVGAGGQYSAVKIACRNFVRQSTALSLESATPG